MSVIPQVCNFKPHYKGSTFSPRNIKFNFDITGATILCQIKQLGVTMIYEWKTGVNITVINATTGEIILDQINIFSPKAGKYQYDLQIVFVDGTSQTYLKGELLVIEDISRIVI